MNIVFVTYHTCARAQKMARALINAGHDVVFVQHLAASMSILYEQNLVTFYKDEEDLAAKVRIFEDWADLFHVHNEPNWPVILTKNATSKPVVFDCHDLESQRHGEATKDEIIAMDKSDGAIFPSYAYAKGAQVTHRLHRDFPVEIVYSMCLEEDHTNPAVAGYPYINGLVYEGHHIAGIEDADFNPGHPLYYGYRDYINFVMECARVSVPVFLYGTKSEFAKQYRTAGAMISEMLPFSEMMRQVSRFFWGFCGHPDDHPQWQKAMPNKLFEYLSAGIPIIAWNCAEVEAWVQEYDIGVVVHNYNELADVFHDHIRRAQKAANVIKLRSEGHFNMEIQVPKIEGLYKKLLT